MKNGVTIGIAFIVALILGGFGAVVYMDEPEVIEIPEITLVPEELPSEFNGSQVFENTTIVVEIVMVEVVEVVEEVKVYPTLVYCTCDVEYPDNVIGWDTPCERAAMLQAELDTMTDSIYEGKVVQQRYQYKGKQAMLDFYAAHYQSKLDSYINLYCAIGNMILSDSEDYETTLTVAGFNFTSPWGDRNLGNGSFTFDTNREVVSFVGINETASGKYVTANETGAIIEGMFYTYLGNDATLPGNTEVTF